jgi:hypothetical protein
MFTVYSNMFRFTRVIFRLELYYLRGHCAYSGIPDAYMFSYVDVIYSITTEGCNKCHCYGIVTNYSRCKYR